MSRTIVFRGVARREFDDAIECYETERSGLGLEFKAEVDRFLIRIVEAPEHFRQVRGLVRRAILRRFPYSIHFLPEVERIVVLAVFHAKRDPRLLERRY